MSGGLWQRLRIAALLLLLVAVAVETWHTAERSTRWDQPLYVAIYPIAADDSPATQAFVTALVAENFRDIDAFFVREGARYGIATDTPVKTRLKPELRLLPPPRPAGAGMVRTALWSLSLRLWAWRVSGKDHEPEDIRVFVLYHDPDRSPTVPHSLGLTKGLIGVVYAFATTAMSGTNNVVIAHEMLHTLGATDKYDPVDDAPLFPDGYGEPDARPLFPQRYAELMAGRRALAPDRFEEPDDLDQVLIGPATAREIRMLRSAR